MTIEISTDQLILYNLDVSQYMLCMALYQGKTDDMIKYFEHFGPLNRGKIDDLIERKIIRSVSSNSVAYSNLRIDEKRFLAIMDVVPVNKWIEEWYDLWPKGVKSGGYYVRSDENACRVKMTRFLKKYPKYTKDIIMEATTKYLFIRSLDGYEYTKLAPNFIELNGVSVLAGECENILNNMETERPKIVQGNLFGDKEL